MDNLAQIFQVSRKETGFAVLGVHRLKEFSIVGAAVINIMAKNGTNWYVWGSVTGATAPAFADQ